MDKTKIEWCDSTWNPVTSCLHGCDYCYAKRIADRFKTHDVSVGENVVAMELNNPFEIESGKKQAYPFGFTPTLHRYRLSDFKKKTGRTIFVCSMADLFGEWVPDEWIEEVFAACKAAPQHRYLFLTKNPQRYINLSEKGILPEAHEQPNFWFGTSVTDGTMLYFWSEVHNTFISAEPILASFGKASSNIKTDWVIIGAETGTRRDRVVPKYEWVINLRNECWQQGKSVFMKDSLIPIVGEENMSRELPWDRKTYRR